MVAARFHEYLYTKNLTISISIGLGLLVYKYLSLAILINYTILQKRYFRFLCQHCTRLEDKIGKRRILRCGTELLQGLSIVCENVM
jgi:hypothetical protein